YRAEDGIRTGHVTGVQTGDLPISATTGTLTFTSLVTTTSNVGSYAINGSGLTANNGNYTFAQAAANATALNITAATLTVKPRAVSVTYSGVALSNTAYSDDTSNYYISGFQNSETVVTGEIGRAACRERSRR